MYIYITRKINYLRGSNVCLHKGDENNSTFALFLWAIIDLLRCKTMENWAFFI